MTKENFINKWASVYNVNDTTNPYFISDLDAVIANEIAKAQEVQSQPSDKVQISKHTLVEVNRAFRALKRDTESYVHKVFGDDGVFDAMKEISEAYKYYFGEYPTEQIPSTPTEKQSSQAKLDNSFDKDRFERIFCAIVASGKTETWEQDFKGTIKTIEKLDAYYASKKGGNNE